MAAEIDAKKSITAILLAGGKSRRMGPGIDKSLLKLKGTPLIQHVFSALEPNFYETIISTNSPSKYSFLSPSRFIEDKEPDCGPLMGVASCLEASKTELNFVVACDMPVLDFGVVNEMLFRLGSSLAVVPRHSDSKLEPLFAVYKKDIQVLMFEALRKGTRSLQRFLGEVDISCVDVEEVGLRLVNLNTEAEYEAFLEQNFAG